MTYQKKTVETLKGIFLIDLSARNRYIPIVKKIINQSEKRVFEGEILPAKEKVYSLFEEHTELLKRGKASKPIEFGHKILLAQNEEKYITHYDGIRHRKEVYYFYLFFHALIFDILLRIDSPLI